jgi:hypothetical protein
MKLQLESLTHEDLIRRVCDDFYAAKNFGAPDISEKPKMGKWNDPKNVDTIKEKRAWNIAYREAEGRAKTVFRDNVEEVFMTKDNPKAEKLWSLAWEYGHSSGLLSVVDYYSDLVELVR